mgnify:CR=1 FL=1
MGFDIFDESFYLSANPDIAAAVASGAFASGLAHFQQFGLFEGRTAVSSLYSEALYLQAYPDVAAAVASGALASGLQHFITAGEAEGRLGYLGLYNESAYLAANPDVAAVVAAGGLDSGFTHFVTSVLATGSTESRYNALFDEPYYLWSNPDVANAVAAGALGSGLEHFIAAGLDEGRRGGVPFNEGAYLRRYGDVAAAVAAGGLPSGKFHYAIAGEQEGRQAGYFEEDFYRFQNPDVAAAIASGAFAAGEEHFLRAGQFEGRTAFFAGTSGNDIIRSYGSGTGVTGVAVDFATEVDDNGDIVNISVNLLSTGVGEVDILYGGALGPESFNLGAGGSGGVAQKYYVGNGDGDYALVRNFDVDQDRLLLAGDISEYTQTLISGGLRIATTAGDLIALVEGVVVPFKVTASTIPNTFVLTQAS